MRGQRGFTLIEMAMVMVLIGLMVSGGLFAIGPVLERAHYNQTNASMDQIESALVLFAIRNNRLPCPADGHLGASAAANYGIEQVSTGAGIAAACPVAATNSVVPWITLGLDEGYSIDGWGRRISYVPANGSIPPLNSVDSLVEHTPATSPACQGTTAGCTLCLSRTIGSSLASTRQTNCEFNNTPISPSYPWGSYIPVYSTATTATELTLPQPAAGPCGTGFTGGDSTVTTINGNVGCAGGRAAYVLISHGRSGWYGWQKSSSVAAAQIQPSNGIFTNKTYNNTGKAPTGTGPGFVQGTPMGSWPPGSNIVYFDDIVRWRTPAFIIQLCGSGGCGNP